MFWIFSKKKKNNKQVEKVKDNNEHMSNSKEQDLNYSKAIYELSDEISKNVGKLVKEEGSMNNGLDQLLKGSEYTTEQTEGVNEYLHNLSNNNDKTRKLVDVVFLSLDDSNKEIDVAKREFNELIDQVGTVSQVFEEFLKLISDIQEHYNSIQGLAAIIDGIAEQTNLLSLNASIEAARVGEAGKGFSVVANEIKKLSLDTQSNAKDIMDSLKKLTTSMESLINKSNEGASVISKTTEKIEGSSSILTKIGDAEAVVHKHVQIVQDSQAENLHGIREISNNLSNLVNKSKSENQELEDIIYSIQKKADYYMNIINYLNQIDILKKEKKD